MKQILITSLIITLWLIAAPSMAISDLAEKFIFQCRQLDITFPPEDWSDEDLRTAALEVLDDYENGTGEDWTVHFCLVTLGHTENPEDTPRILVYEETLPISVIRAFRGFPHPDAVDCLLRHLDSDSAGTREQVIYGLSEIDYDSMGDDGFTREIVISELSEWREKEEFDLLVELIDDTINNIELSGSSVN